MSNNVYDRARYEFVTGAFNWPTMELVLAAMAGTPDFVPTDMTIDQVLTRGTLNLGYSLPVTSRTVAADGTTQTNQVLIPDVPVGQDITWFVLAERNATLPLSQLILFIDEAKDLPFVPNGLDVVIQPDWLENRGWFRG